MVTRKLTDGQNDVAPVRPHIRQPALQQDGGVVANNRIDAGGLVAGENDAGQDKRNDVFAMPAAIPVRPSRRLADFAFSAAAVSSISFNSIAACLLRARAEQRGARGFFLAPAKQPARRFGHQETAHDKQNSRRQRHPENAAPGACP